MMAFASTEFIALCQSQIVLLTQALGASSTVIYLAEQAKDGMGLSLVPLVAYPETADVWARLAESLALMAQQVPTVEVNPGADSVGAAGTVTSAETVESDRGSAPRVAAPQNSPSTPFAADALDGDGFFPAVAQEVEPPPLSQTAGVARSSLPDAATAIPPLALPLIHEGVALGMLVSTRETLTWKREEKQQAEQVANTLALAWVLDQRGQWLQQQLQQRHLTQANQSETFHDLLHQFRNPLTALQTFGRLLVKRIPEDDPNQPIAEGIVRESRRLQDLATTFDEAIAQGDESLDAPTATPSVGRLLPGGKLDPGADPLEMDSSSNEPTPGAMARLHEASLLGRRVQREPETLDKVVRPLLQSAWAIAQERDLTLTAHWPSDLPPVWLDRAALAEVISNVLDNALKYSPAGAQIWVLGGLEKTMGGQTYQGLAVGDTGQGIPATDQPRIFERHFRGVQAEGALPGTGLGLAIAQELMTTMGGHLELLSPVPPELWPREDQPEGQGPGTLFLLWLPRVTEEGDGRSDPA